jgi:3-deoxy-7-phosphoheptulonate synthase
MIRNEDTATLGHDSANGSKTLRNDSTDDTRILSYDPLLPPQILMEEIPLTGQAKADIQRFRAEASRIVAGIDDRLLIVVGPCSIHDPDAALEYAGRLKAVKEEISDACLIVMRSYCNFSFLKNS